MTMKDILVHVDNLPSCKTRLWLAGQLARRFDAYLTGVGAPEAAEAEERFETLLAQEELPGEWRTIIGLLATGVTKLAAGADLVVLSQPDPDRLLAELNTPEDVILACGRPVLMVPYQGDFDHVGERVLAAWNGTREATRALHDAIPLMTTATAVTVLSVDPRTEHDDSRKALIHHLGRHGLAASPEVTERRDRGIAEIIKARAVELGCDLVIMGAYSHSRLREMVLGGATQDMLNSMTLPVLIAH